MSDKRIVIEGFEQVDVQPGRRHLGWFNWERRPDVREGFIRSAEQGAARGYPTWVHDHPSGEPCNDACVFVGAAPSESPKEGEPNG